MKLANLLYKNDKGGDHSRRLYPEEKLCIQEQAENKKQITKYRYLYKFSPVSFTTRLIL